MSLRQRLLRLFANRRELVGMNRRNVELVYANNRRSDYPIADDKLLCKEYLRRGGVPVPETLAVCRGLVDIPATVAALEAREHFVVKPANGSGGNGILVVRERLPSGGWRLAGGGAVSAEGLGKHLADVVFGAFSADIEDVAFVEGRIEPHRVFSTLWSDGLCDVRVITLKARPVMSMVRVPTRRSRGKANLHQGGLGLAIDLATGRTFRALSQGRTLVRHPESSQPLIDVQIPDWQAVLDVACRAARAVPLGYLGVDIVCDRDKGPLVLEINARPGLEIQNVHGYGIGRAMASMGAA